MRRFADEAAGDVATRPMVIARGGNSAVSDESPSMPETSGIA